MEKVKYFYFFYLVKKQTPSNTEFYIPCLFRISVEDISMRNLSAGIGINMSFSSSGISRSSRTCRKILIIIDRDFKKKNMKKGRMLSQALIIWTHLENAIYVSTTHKVNASCSFARPKYFQHLLGTPIIVFWLQGNRNNCEKSTVISCNAYTLDRNQLLLLPWDENQILTSKTQPPTN